MIPTLKLTLRVRNPDWVAIFGSNGMAMNMDEYDADIEFMVEVLTVHFSTNTMRVRFTHMDKVKTLDVDATPFFERYSLSND